MELTQKGEMVSRLQAKAGQIGKILNNLEKYNHLLKDDNKKPERKSSDKRSSIIRDIPLRTPTDPYKIDQDILMRAEQSLEAKRQARTSQMEVEPSQSDKQATSKQAVEVVKKDVEATESNAT